MRCSSFLCCVTVPLASCHANKTNGNKPLTASSLARVRRKKLFGELIKLLNNIITGTENSEGEEEGKTGRREAAVFSRRRSRN